MTKMNKLTSAIILSLYGFGAIAEEVNKDIDAEEGKLEVIEVTATKRVQNLQNTPVAVTVFTADTIEEAGINNTHDLAALTPSLSTTESRSPFQTRLSIRGIGTAQNDPALEPSVGIFVNGVFLGRTGLGMSELTDIERIEVLQGPQGTLYGKNTNAGAISVITKLPDLEQFDGYAEIEAGNFGAQRITLAATGPISDALAYRVSGSTHERDAYYENATGADPSDANDWNVQGKLLWVPNDDLTVALGASHVERDSNCCGTDVLLGDEVLALSAAKGLTEIENNPTDYKTATNVDSKFEMETDFVSLHIDYDMGWGEINSITSYNEYEYFTRSDADSSQLDIIANLGEQFSGDSFTQELRLDAILNDTIDYQIGLFYHDQTSQRGDGEISRLLGEDFLTIAGQTLPDINHPQLGAVPARLYLPAIAQPGDYIAGENIWNSETLAVFGQITWHVTDSLRLNAGLRWSDEDKEADLLTETHSTANGIVRIPRPPQLGGPIVFSLPPQQATPFVNLLATPIDETLTRNSKNTDWMLKASYNLDKNNMVYAGAATGTKSGNFNGVSGSPEQREFDDEETLSYELGLKSTFLDSTVRVNTALFYTKIEDYQFLESQDLGGILVSTDGEVVVSGLDMSIEAMPFENLALSAGFLYMDRYDITEGPNAGSELGRVPELSGNIGATAFFPVSDGMIYMRGDYIFKGDESVGNGTEVDRETVNVKVGWRNDNWNISIWAKNLTDEEYINTVNATQSFSGNSAHLLSPPRTIGLTVRYSLD